jgi:hypothetical protein
MGKRIMILLIFIYCFHPCSAPNLSDIQSAESFQTAVMEIKKAEWEREFVRWKVAMGINESGGNWTSCNDIGCIGTYQFRIATLEFLGFSGITLEKFKTNPEIFPEELQDEAMCALISYNEICLRQFEQFIGMTIDGVLITRSGLLAAAHLGGVGAVKSFLIDKENRTDLYGTTIKDYIVKFQGYNI